MISTWKQLNELIREATVLRNMELQNRNLVAIAIVEQKIDDLREKLGLARAA